MGEIGGENWEITIEEEGFLYRDGEVLSMATQIGARAF